MSISNISDSKLVEQTFRALPWMTLCLALMSLISLLLTESDSSQVAFALNLNNSALKAQLAFDTTAPLKAFATPLVTSFFVHDSPKHLFANLPWLIFSGAAMQKHFSARWVVLILMLGHIAAVFGATAAHHWASAPALALGMSGGVFSLLFAWLFWRFKFWGWVALLATFGVLLGTHVNAFFTHAPAMVLGCACGTLFLKKNRTLLKS